MFQFALSFRWYLAKPMEKVQNSHLETGQLVMDLTSAFVMNQVNILQLYAFIDMFANIKMYVAVLVCVHVCFGRGLNERPAQLLGFLHVNL